MTSPVLKFIVALLGAATTAIQAASGTSPGSTRWAEVFTAVISAALVYLVPNGPKP